MARSAAGALRELIGAQLVKWIQRRRDGVEAMAQRYYRLLADVVDVTTAPITPPGRGHPGVRQVEMTVAADSRLPTRPGIAADSPRVRPATCEYSSGRQRQRGGERDGGGPPSGFSGGDGDDRLVDSATGGRNRFYDDSSGAGSTLGGPADVDRRP